MSIEKTLADMMVEVEQQTEVGTHGELMHEAMKAVIWTELNANRLEVAGVLGRMDMVLKSCQPLYAMLALHCAVENVRRECRKAAPNRDGYDRMDKALQDIAAEMGDAARLLAERR